MQFLRWNSAWDGWRPEGAGELHIWMMPCLPVKNRLEPWSCQGDPTVTLRPWRTVTIAVLAAAKHGCPFRLISGSLSCSYQLPRGGEPPDHPCETPVRYLPQFWAGHFARTKGGVHVPMALPCGQMSMRYLGH